MKRYEIVYDCLPSFYNHIIEAENIRDGLVRYCKKVDASIIEHFRNSAVIRFWKNMEHTSIKIFLKKDKRNESL